MILVKNRSCLLIMISFQMLHPSVVCLLYSSFMIYFHMSHPCVVLCTQILEILYFVLFCELKVKFMKILLNKIPVANLNLVRNFLTRSLLLPFIVGKMIKKKKKKEFERNKNDQIEHRVIVPFLL